MIKLNFEGTDMQQNKDYYRDFEIVGKIQTKFGELPVKSKAKLEDGSIVTYDICCKAGEVCPIDPKKMSTFLGRGTLYEVEGVQLHETGLTKSEYYDFWKVHD